MRELKFRAWDKVKRKMLYGVSPFNAHITDENEPLLSLEYSKHDDCEFMQYIGFKDKKGKEIYYGDIIKLDGRRARKDDARIYEVIEDDYYCCPTTRSIDKEDCDIYFNAGATEMYFKVIGNIHENPELLKGEE